MSNRVRRRAGRPSRSTGRSYTERLQRAKAYRPPTQLPAWLFEARRLAQPQVAALLVLVAEVGHLAAAWTEWPAAAARGVFHVVVAGILGLAAVAISFDPPRVQLGLAMTATVLVPLCWAVGALAGLSPYRYHPVAAASLDTAVELAAAALIAVGWLTLRGPQRAARRPADPVAPPQRLGAVRGRQHAGPSRRAG